jgi:hypothetical protein
MSIRTARLVTVAAVALALTGCASSTGTTASPAANPAPAASAPVTGASTTGPASTSWAAPADASAAVRAAGLPMLGEEKLAVHYHAHLDVIVNGRAVPVPAGLGIDEARQLISPLHTHDVSGVVHIESATDVPFTLGQLFAEWGQPLRADQVGPVTLSQGTVLRVYRNGQPVNGDAATMRLGAHDEIVVWVGPTSEQPQVPASYGFPPGK